MRVNERIRIAQIRVIAEDGSQLGVMSPQEALKIAREQGYDLVEVAPNVSPPVCRIMDFNKFKYEQTKKDRESKKRHHVAKLKEIKFKPRIGDHDYQVKLAQIKKFLSRGDMTKITMVFRGREMSHTELGRKVLNRLIVDLDQIGRIDKDVVLEGRFMTMILTPDHAALKRLSRQHKQSSSDTSREAVPQEPEVGSPVLNPIKIEPVDLNDQTQGQKS